MKEVPETIKAWVEDPDSLERLSRYIPMMERYLGFVWEHDYDNGTIANWEMAALSFAMEYTAEGYTETYAELDRLIRDHVDVVRYNSDSPQAIPAFLTAGDYSRIIRGGDSRGEPYHTNYLMKVFANIVTYDDLVNLLLIPFRTHSVLRGTGIFSEDWHLEVPGDRNRYVKYYNIVYNGKELRLHDNYDGPAMVFRPDIEDEENPLDACWILVKDESSFFKGQFRSAVCKYYEGDTAEFTSLSPIAKIECTRAVDSGCQYLRDTELYSAVRYRGFKRLYEKYNLKRYHCVYTEEGDVSKDVLPKMTAEECKEYCRCIDDIYKRFISGLCVSPREIQTLDAYDMLDFVKYGHCREHSDWRMKLRNE